MPVSRVIAQLHIPAAAAAQSTTIRNALNGDLPAANRIIDKPRDWVTTTQSDGSVDVVLDIRLTTRANADTLYGKWSARWSNFASTYGITGRISIHDCTHGEAGQQDCTIGMTWVGG